MFHLVQFFLQPDVLRPNEKIRLPGGKILRLYSHRSYSFSGVFTPPNNGADESGNLKGGWESGKLQTSFQLCEYCCPGLQYPSDLYRDHVYGEVPRVTLLLAKSQKKGDSEVKTWSFMGLWKRVKPNKGQISVEFEKNRPF